MAPVTVGLILVQCIMSLLLGIERCVCYMTRNAVLDKSPPLAFEHVPVCLNIQAIRDLILLPYSGLILLHARKS